MPLDRANVLYWNLRATSPWASLRDWSESGNLSPSSGSRPAWIQSFEKNDNRGNNLVDDMVGDVRVVRESDVPGDVTNIRFQIICVGKGLLTCVRLGRLSRYEDYEQEELNEWMHITV